MISNNICLVCDKQEVCKIKDILSKFEADAKKPLFVDISIDNCDNYNENSEETA